MKKIVSVVGARPQFVKAAVVSEQLRRVGIEEVMIHTGQHYDANMSDAFFEVLGIPEPRYNLGIGGGSHGEMTGRQLIEIEHKLLDERPQAVLVYGDTNSTLAGALAAVKLHIPVAHVEAGLRSFNQRMPEEINRIVTDRVSSVLFTPSRLASDNLRAEGVAARQIVEVGDVMYDAALRYGNTLAASGDRHSFFLVTIHRAENTDSPQRMRAIVDALKELGRRARVVFPVHPRTRQVLVRSELWDELGRSIELVDPVGYIEMLTLMRGARAVLTDSGGVQKEAYFMGTSCITLRDETEWKETVDLGWNTLVTDLTRDNIVTAAVAAIAPPPSTLRPYGDGHASDRIAEYLLALLQDH